MNQTADNKADNPANAVVEQPTVRRQFFSPDQLDRASEAVSAAAAICEASNLPFMMGFDGEPTTGFGIGIVPITKRAETRGTVLLGVVIAQVPTAETIAGHPKGADYIESLIQADLLTKAKLAVAPRGNSTAIMGSIPASVEDYIISSRGEGLATYRELAPVYVSSLKKMGLKLLNAQLLRQILESSAFAQHQYQNVDNAVWIKILDLMVGHAKREGLDTAILEHWKATRDEVEIDLGSIDVEMFAALE